MEEQIDKYREVLRMAARIESLPKNIRQTKFTVPPHIPVEFRQGKIPSNMFFAPQVFTLEDINELLKEFQQVVGEKIPSEIKSKINKEG